MVTALRLISAMPPIFLYLSTKTFLKNVFVSITGKANACQGRKEKPQGFSQVAFSALRGRFADRGAAPPVPPRLLFMTQITLFDHVFVVSICFPSGVVRGSRP